MLVEETVHNEESTVIGLKNIDSSKCDTNKDETADCLNSNLTSSSKTCVDKVNDDDSEGIELHVVEERCSVPVDYQLLPQEFFDRNDIPLPLVLKVWLDQLNEISSNKTPLENQSDDSEDESIPLVKLKHKLSNSSKKLGTVSDKQYNNQNHAPEERIKSTNEKKSKKSKSLKKNELPVVNRKRGRPKKAQKDSNLSIIDDDLLIKDDDADNGEDRFWNNESDSSSLHSPLHLDTKCDQEENNSTAFSYNEHDYFKPAENETNIIKEEKNELSKRRQERVTVQGIKSEDSKMSFPCLDCGKSFSAASTLKHHLRIHNGTLLKCTECNKGFTTKYLLKCHMRIHSGDLFMCHKCGKGFITAELLKVHSRSHTGDRPFVCKICEKTFPSASNLSQHKQTHEKEKRFLCFQCGSSFSQKRCLDGHMLTHSEKNHICTVCGKLWARKSDLREHMRVHTGVKPYCCDMCPQKFTQASSLKRHKIVHLEVKPIQCLTCNKLFKCQQYYKRHVRKHESEADYLFNN